MSLLNITISANTPDDYRAALLALNAGTSGVAIEAGTAANETESAGRRRRTKAEMEAARAAEAAKDAGEPEQSKEAATESAKTTPAEKATLRSRGAIVDEPPADETDADDGDAGSDDAGDGDDDDLGVKKVDVNELKADLQAIRSHSAPALAELLSKHGGSPKFREVPEAKYPAVQAAASAYIKKNGVKV